MESRRPITSYIMNNCQRPDTTSHLTPEHQSTPVRLPQHRQGLLNDGSVNIALQKDLTTATIGHRKTVSSECEVFHKT